MSTAHDFIACVKDGAFADNQSAVIKKRSISYYCLGIASNTNLNCISNVHVEFHFDCHKFIASSSS